MKTSAVIKEVEINDDRKFGAATIYFPALVRKNGTLVPALFTMDQLDDATARAQIQPEDAPKPTLLARILALFLFITPTLCLADSSWEPSDKYSVEIAQAFERSENWSKQEKIAFSLSVVGHAADLYTTLRSNNDPAKGPFCRETNPILSDNPSTLSLVAVKAAAIGLEYWIYSNPRFNSSRTPYYGYASFLIHAAAAYNNTQNDCYGVN